MSSLSTQTTVGELVAQRPNRSRVFEKLGIDYCCGGKRSLQDACKQRGLDAQTVLQVLEAAEQGQPAGGPAVVDAAQMTLSELADHIEATHHAYLKQELPRLAHLTNKVGSVHGQEHPELAQVAQVFAGLQEEMTQHMYKEEHILFPAVRNMEKGTPGHNCFGTVANPIRMMEMEHDAAGAALAKMRELTGGYAAPATACNSWRAMLDGLLYLEQDMHQHVHKENNILFPKAIALEKR